MSEMTSGLVERIEAATGPDRELDTAIWLLARTMPSGTVLRPYGDVPQFTNLIDIAMTLVPEGVSSLVDIQSGFRDGRQHGFAHVVVTSANGWAVGERAVAKTPALALCAAALRARALANNPSEVTP